MNLLRQHSKTWPSCLLVEICQILFVSANVGLVIGNFQYFNLLHGPFEILLSNSSSFTHISQSVSFIFVFPDEVNHSLSPPTEISFFS